MFIKIIQKVTSYCYPSMFCGENNFIHTFKFKSYSLKNLFTKKNLLNSRNNEKRDKFSVLLFNCFFILKLSSRKVEQNGRKAKKKTLEIKILIVLMCFGRKH